MGTLLLNMCYLQGQSQEDTGGILALPGMEPAAPRLHNEMQKGFAPSEVFTAA